LACVEQFVIQNQGQEARHDGREMLLVSVLQVSAGISRNLRKLRRHT
jgi:hypothetical protein